MGKLFFPSSLGGARLEWQEDVGSIYPSDETWLDAHRNAPRYRVLILPYQDARFLSVPVIVHDFFKI